MVPCREWSFEEGYTGRGIVTEWQLVCGRRWLLPLSSLAFLAAAIVAVPMAGLASDQVGRKPILFVAVVALLISGFGSTFARSFYFFTAVRLVVSSSASTIQVRIPR